MLLIPHGTFEYQNPNFDLPQGPVMAFGKFVLIKKLKF
jgi:hypothetical protein